MNLNEMLAGKFGALPPRTAETSLGPNWSAANANIAAVMKNASRPFEPEPAEIASLLNRLTDELDAARTAIGDLTTKLDQVLTPSTPPAADKIVGIRPAQTGMGGRLSGLLVDAQNTTRATRALFDRVAL